MTTTHAPTAEDFRTTFEGFAASCGVPAEVSAAALERLSAPGRPLLVATSGRLVAGKDTVPVEVLARLGRPAERVRHLYFADALKGDVDCGLEALRSNPHDDDRAGVLATALPMEGHHAAHLAALLDAELADDESVSARSRTPGMRAALQYYGTDVRRARDEDYWAKRALAPAVEAIAQGCDVYFSDLRFPNEVTGAQRLGFFVVRLEISPEVQRERLLARDGLEPDPAALNHASERALDDFCGFDLVFDNDGTVEQAVDAVTAALRTAGQL